MSGEQYLLGIKSNVFDLTMQVDHIFPVTLTENNTKVKIFEDPDIHPTFSSQDLFYTFVSLPFLTKL